MVGFVRFLHKIDELVEEKKECCEFRDNYEKAISNKDKTLLESDIPD